VKNQWNLAHLCDSISASRNHPIFVRIMTRSEAAQAHKSVDKYFNPESQMILAIGRQAPIYPTRVILNQPLNMITEF
jgi:hypothetical protein